MRPHTRTQCQAEKGPNQCQECSGGHGGSSGSINSFLDPNTSPPLHTTLRDRHFSSVASNMSSVSSSNQSQEKRTPALVEMPAELLVKILGYLSFKELSLIRMVSRRFNELCASMLNVTFQSLQKSMLERFQMIKSKMPRRESARRNHPLGRECGIVEILHMRLTLMQMQFGKHIEREHVCFFAGEILDEVYRILRNIKSGNNLTQEHEVTEELFDLSTMAMEYFKEHLEPTLPEVTFFGSDFLDFSTTFTSPCKKRMQSGNQFLDASCSSSVVGSEACWSISGGSSSFAPSGSMVSSGYCDDDEDDMVGEAPIAPPNNTGSNMVLRKRIKKIRLGMKRYNDQLVDVKRELKATKSKMESQIKQVTEYSKRLENYDKKFEDSSRKFQTLLTELNKCKTELQFWRSKSSLLLSIPTTRSICSKCETNSIFSPAAKEGDEANIAEESPNGFNNEVVPDLGKCSDEADDVVSVVSGCASDVSGHDFKTLANQGVFLPGGLGVMTRNMTLSNNSDTTNISGGLRGAFTRSSVDGTVGSATPKVGTSEKPTKTCKSDLGSPASPRPVTRSRPPSPADHFGSRKRKSGVEEETTRKSLRGSGIKNKKTNKRPKV